MKNKGCSLVFAVFMLAVSLLAACNRNGEQGTYIPYNVDNLYISNDYVSHEPTPPLAFIETPMDLDGRVVRMLTQRYNWFQLRGWDYIGTEELLRIIREIAHEYNFTLELTNAPHNSVTTMEFLIAERAGGTLNFEILDFLVHGISQELMFLQGHVMPLCHPAISNIVRFDEQPFHIKSDLANMFSYQWGIHIPLFNHTNILSGVVTFNRNLMEELNLPSFYDMFRQDVRGYSAWTWDNFEQITRQIIALNPNIIPIIQTNEASFMPHIIASNGGELIVRNNDGSMNFVGNTDSRTLAALVWAQTLINDGLLRFDADVSRYFDTGNAMFIMGSYSNLRYRGLTAFIQSNSRVGLMPIPRGPQMDTFTSVSFSTNMFYITDGISYPEEIAAVLVAFANRLPHPDIVQREIDFALMDTESAEVLNHLLGVKDIDFSRTLSSTRSHISHALSLIISNQSALEVMQTVSYDVQDILDQAWEQFNSRR